MMAWDLSANYSWELLRHDLVAKVGAERMAELMPPYPPSAFASINPAMRLAVSRACSGAGEEPSRSR